MRGFGEACAVTRGPFPAEVVPVVDMFQLGAEHSGVQIVQTAVESEAVAGALLGAVIAQLANDAIDFSIVGDDCAAVAECAEVLLDDEADGGGVAEFADAEAVAMSTDGLCVVFDDEQVMLVGDLADRLHVGALAVKMNGHDRLGAGSDGGFDLAWDRCSSCVDRSPRIQRWRR